MFDDVISYLSDFISPERLALIRTALDTLSRYGDQGYVDNLTNAVLMADQAGDMETVELINDLLDRTFYDHCLTYGVELTNDLTIGMMTLILSGLHTLQDYDDVDFVINTCEDDTLSPELALAYLLGAQASTPWTDIIGAFDSVSTSLITRIEQLVKLRETLDQVIDEKPRRNIERVVARLKHYRETVSIDLVEDLLERQYTLAAPIAQYLTIYRNVLLDMKVDAATEQLIGLVLASETPTEAIADELDRQITALYEEISLRAQAHKRVFELKGAITHA